MPILLPGLSFSQPLALAGLAVLLIVAAVHALSAWYRGIRRRQDIPPRIQLLRPQAHFGAIALIYAALAGLALALAGPRVIGASAVPTARGRGFVFILDVSHSMDAEAPSRLQRAQRMLDNFARWLERRGGHRVGLLVFAAGAEVACPLTNDYSHFRFAIKNWDQICELSRLRPKEQPSGTRIGTAIIQALRNLADEQSVICLLSDGDDPLADQEWRRGVDAAKELGFAIHVVGIGDPLRDHRIPLESGYLEFQGKVVHTRLREKTLRRIAEQTGGWYLPARDAGLPLGDYFEQLLAESPMREMAPGSITTRWVDLSGWFVIAALVFFASSVLIAEWER